MDNRMPNTTDMTPRRGFIRRIAGTMALGFGALAGPAGAQPLAPLDGPNWPGALKGRHRQLVDAYEINGGVPLEWAYTFLATNPSPAPGIVAATAVVVLRHAAFPIALRSELWRKYKIGEAFKIVDPETKAPAVKNPFLNPKPGVLPIDAMAVDRLLADGTVFGACDVALKVQAKMLAANAGVSADDAVKEWTANVIPGITILPSGTWGVNRAQEAGCTYCTGG